MILQSLCAYYDRLLESGLNTIAGEGFSSENIHFALIINSAGKLVQVLDLQETKGRRKIPRAVLVPQGTKKSVNIAANFLWGNTAYLLGADDKEKPVRTAKCHQAFKELHETLLCDCEDEGARALLSFIATWNPDEARHLQLWPELAMSNLVFQLDGELAFLHARPALRQRWLDRIESSKQQAEGMCLVSGEIAPIARVHPAIKRVVGAQSSGAALVSFNLDAFESFGKEQNRNAPVSENRAAAYTKALNHLLSSGRNKVQFADCTTVFWTEQESPVEGWFGMIINPYETSATDLELATFLQSVREGKLPSGLDSSLKFYILGLSPNAARLSVRFWYVSSVIEISEKLGIHFRDLEMVRSFDSEPEYPSVWQILRETTNLKSKDGPSPLLSGSIMQSILSGSMYPKSLLSTVVSRIRADQNINYLRAAIVRAVLNRKKRILDQGVEVPVSLDKENKSVAYLLGRLFAVLEKAQQDAIPGANTTIKDRFYGAASATPRVVFPQLMRLAQHHIQKAEWGRLRDKQIEEIVSDIREFPAHLGLDQQGLFAIGYYQQRQDFFKKNQNGKEEKEK